VPLDTTAVADEIATHEQTTRPPQGNRP